MSEGDVLFVDEIHRLSRSVEEVLYPAMEDFAVDIIIGKGPSARSIRLDVPRFTLVGATTRSGQLTAPLRDRFGVLLRLELYTPEELARIVTRSAGILGIPIDQEGAIEIASPFERDPPASPTACSSGSGMWRRCALMEKSIFTWPKAPWSGLKSTSLVWMILTGGCCG